MNLAMAPGTEGSQDGTGKDSDKNGAEVDHDKADRLNSEIFRRMRYMPPNKSILNNPVKESGIEQHQEKI
jgi:hypothetical protein